jgi:hypothetical protein
LAPCLASPRPSHEARCRTPRSERSRASPPRRTKCCCSALAAAAPPPTSSGSCAAGAP